MTAPITVTRLLRHGYDLIGPDGRKGFGVRSHTPFRCDRCGSEASCGVILAFVRGDDGRARNPQYCHGCVIERTETLTERDARHAAITAQRDARHGVVLH